MTDVGPIVQVCAPAEFGAVAAAAIGAAIRRRVSEHGQCSLALAGGTTPEQTYVHLSGMSDIPWEKIDIYFTDERDVGPDDARSNYGMAERLLLGRVDIDSRRVHRVYPDLMDVDAAAQAYDAVMPARLDILVLGVGVAGNIASLFPRSSALEEIDRRVLPVRVPATWQRRATITPQVVRAARRVFVLASGSMKARVVWRALETDTTVRACPARLASHAVWIIDEPAASLLENLPTPDKLV